MNNIKKVYIIIPTFNNVEILQQCLNSIGMYTLSHYHIVVVNNGTEKISCENERCEIITPTSNLGWERGIAFALTHMKEKHYEFDYVVFMNDDTMVLPGEHDWLIKMQDIMDKDKSVAAVGPSSNYVMGSQSIWMLTPAIRLSVNFLIGFCVMMRYEMFEKIGKFDFNLKAGDDFDWSIRFKSAGLKLVAARDIFILHLGGTTGKKIRTDWGSQEMQNQCNNDLIKKHGVEKFRSLSLPVEEYVHADSLVYSRNIQ